MPTQAHHYSTETEALVARHMDRLRGRCCGAVESWGLDDRRERAMIALLKSLTYDCQDSLLEVLRRVEAEAAYVRRTVTA